MDEIDKLIKDNARLRRKVLQLQTRVHKDAQAIAQLLPLRGLATAIESWITSRRWSDEQSADLLRITRTAITKSAKAAQRHGWPVFIGEKKQHEQDMGGIDGT